MKITWILLALLSVPMWVSAQTIEAKKREMKWSAENTRSQALLLEKCGYEIPAAFDAAGFEKAGFVEKKKDPSKVCSEAHWAVRSLCEDKVAKPVVQEKIKKISCKAGKEQDLNFAIAGGEFTVTVGPNAKNVSQKTKEYLKGNL